MPKGRFIQPRFRPVAGAASTMKSDEIFSAADPAIAGGGNEPPIGRPCGIPAPPRLRRGGAGDRNPEEQCIKLRGICIPRKRDTESMGSEGTGGDSSLTGNSTSRGALPQADILDGSTGASNPDGQALRAGSGRNQPAVEPRSMDQAFFPDPRLPAAGPVFGPGRFPNNELIHNTIAIWKVFPAMFLPSLMIGLPSF